MLRSTTLWLCSASCGALQLGASLPRAPATVRPAAPLVMQVPETADAPAAEVAAPMAGRVVPTYFADMSAESASTHEKLVAANPALGTTMRRAEFWSNETCSTLELLNVLGRFQKSADFAERTEFSTVENTRVEDEKQGETKERYDMARRMGVAERVALYQNAPKLPFTDAALAASVGLTVEDFAGLEVTKAACNVVFDALAQSRSGLIPYKVIDERRASMVVDGSLNEIAFRTGLYKSRALIIIAWFLFGKGNFVWVLVSVKLLHDWKPDLIPSPVDMGLFKIGTFI